MEIPSTLEYLYVRALVQGVLQYYFIPPTVRLYAFYGRTDFLVVGVVPYSTEEFSSHVEIVVQLHD